MTNAPVVRHIMQPWTNTRSLNSTKDHRSTDVTTDMVKENVVKSKEIN